MTVATADRAELANIPPQLELQPHERAMLSAIGCDDAPEPQLRMFFTQARRIGLDPFSRQIYLIKRRVKNKQTGGWEDRWSIQTAIDGFRVVAERTKEYRGQTEPQWCGKDGKWLEAWPHDTPPVAARIGVKRAGFDGPLYAVAHYREYCPRNYDGKPQGLWANFPAGQLAKCAEALAMRKAFPQDLSGIYVAEEMDQADGSKVYKVSPEPVGQGRGDGSAPKQTAPVTVEQKPAEDDRNRWNVLEKERAYGAAAVDVDPGAEARVKRARQRAASEKQQGDPKPLGDALKDAAVPLEQAAQGVSDSQGAVDESDPMEMESAVDEQQQRISKIAESPGLESLSDLAALDDIYDIGFSLAQNKEYYGPEHKTTRRARELYGEAWKVLLAAAESTSVDAVDKLIEMATARFGPNSNMVGDIEKRRIKMINRQDVA